MTSVSSQTATPAQAKGYGSITKTSTPQKPTAIKVEPKVFLANERTLFSWMRLSILMGSLSLALFNGSGDDNLLGRYFGFFYSLISVGVLIFGWYVFEKRKKRIREKAGEKDAFDELVGPVVICAALFIGVSTNFILQLAPTLMTHFLHMHQAIDLAKQAQHVPTAFNVGCVIISAKTQKIISTGYSRELAGNTHAEENAINKLPSDLTEDALWLYTTMEPCSKRLSGNKSCTDRILEYNASRGNGKGKIATVVAATGEPVDFVVCEGEKLLKAGGVEVINLGRAGEVGQEIKDIALKVARGE